MIQVQLGALSLENFKGINVNFIMRHHGNEHGKEYERVCSEDGSLQSTEAQASEQQHTTCARTQVQPSPQPRGAEAATGETRQSPDDPSDWEDCMNSTHKWLENRQTLDLKLIALLCVAFISELAAVASLRPPPVHWQGGVFQQWSCGFVVLGLLLTLAIVTYVEEMEKADALRRRRISSTSDAASTNATEAGGDHSGEPGSQSDDPGQTDTTTSDGSPDSLDQHRRIEAARMLRLLLAVGAVMVVGAVLFAATKAYALLSTFLFFPLNMLATVALREQCIARDGALFDDPQAPPPRNRRCTTGTTPVDTTF